MHISRDKNDDGRKMIYHIIVKRWLGLTRDGGPSYVKYSYGYISD